MNCADCGQPIRPTREDDGIGQYDSRYEFEYVHEDGNPVCDGTFTARPRASRLTDTDRETIALARTIGATLRARNGKLYNDELDRLAGWLIKELADRLEQLGGDAAQTTEET